MKWSALKYLMLFILPVGAFISFTHYGAITFIPVLIAFVLIPGLEFFIAPDPKNLLPAEEEMIKEDVIYDLMLYAFIPVQFILMYIFLTSIQSPDLSMIDYIGKISAMGILCGVIGINLGHELGHRTKGYEIFFAKSLLLSSLYLHFHIEHNRGHHKNVSTPEDPASARYNEALYRFWFRSIFGGYLSAWILEKERLKKSGLQNVSFGNEMIQFTGIQTFFVLGILLLFGLLPTLAFLCSAAIGGLLLETVNYIEHYGLTRSKNESGRYEITKPIHSWNSNHVVGRLFLFELSRHSDHHYKTNRKYQVLRHFDKSPQMPTGYPGMMLLSMIPPLWFSVMNKRVRLFQVAA